MPWKDHLNRFKQELNHRVGEPGAASKPPAVPPHPPALPPHPPAIPPHPPAIPPRPPAVPPSRSEVHWKPQFYPNVPINLEWDAKLGNGPDGWGNQELQYYTAEPQNAFHTPEGLLVVRALANNSAPSPEQRYTSARLVSRQTLARDKGVLTATILSPCAEGIWPAFWLLPREPFSWPTDGEIDIAETWNGDHENRSCLHWGHHHEPQKHRVLGTRIPDMHSRPVRYDFAWEQPNGVPGQGRMIWYIDGRPVMKGEVPSGTRPLRDMNILLNVAVGGNVCGGKVPRDGYYDMVVYNLSIVSELEYGGWARFEQDWHHPAVSMGNTY